MVQVPGGAGGGLNQIEFQLRIAADATGAVQASQGLQQVQKQADRTASSLSRAFGPRVIAQMTQVRGKLVEQGQALVGFGKGLQTSEQLSGRLRTQLEGTGKGLAAMGVAQTKAGQAGRTNAKVMQAQAGEMARASGYIRALAVQEEARLQTLQRMAAMSQTRTAAQKNAAAAVQMETAAVQENIRVLRLHSATLEQGAANQAVFAQQTQRATLTMGSFSGESTMAQKAGQGMILSFSAAQAAAGNYQQALFGLGFSLLFVGRSLLGWPLAIAGIATALTVGLPVLIKWVKSTEDIETPTERATRLSEEFAEALEKVKDPLAEVAETQARLAEQREPVFEALARQALDAAPPSENLNRVLAELNLTMRELATTSPEAMRGFARDIPPPPLAPPTGLLNVEERESLERLNAAREEAIALYGDWQKARSVAISQIEAELDLNVRRQMLLRQEIEANNEREAGLEALDDAYEAASDAADESYEIAVEAARETAENEIIVLRESLATQTQARRYALEDWIVARRGALQETIDTIDKERDASVKAAQDASSARIEAVEKERDRVIEVSREKVEELRNLERSLVAEVRDLESQRRQALQDILVTEAEIAEIEAILRKFGPDPALEAELALRKARLAALEEARSEMDKEISTREETIDTLDEQIDAEEERQKEVRETARAAVAAERDATRERVNEIRRLARVRSDKARDAADAEIREQQRAVNASLALLSKGVDDKVRLVNKGRDAAIKAAREERRANVDVAETIRDQGRAKIDVGREQEDLNKLVQRQVDLELQIAFLAGASRRQAEAIAFVPEYIAQLLRQGYGGLATALTIISFLQRKGVSKGVIESILREQGLPVPAFQFGGTVPGAPGEPRLIVAHGGEEISRPGAAPVTVIFQIENLYTNKPSDIDRITRSVNRGLGRKASLGVRTGRYLS